jgi:DNA-binding CsgD family transcriptional regulator
MSVTNYEIQIMESGEFSPRETQILKALAEGHPDKVISDILGITVKTVDTYLGRIYVKMGLRHKSINHRCRAIGIALASGVIKLTEANNDEP